MKISKEEFKKDFLTKLSQISIKCLENTSDLQRYQALGLLTRDYISKYWLQTKNETKNENKKEVYYFSIEFLTGKFLLNNLKNLGIYDEAKEALESIDISVDKLSYLEKEQGLGNGGLGRLAACFLDSFASLNLAGHGVGIRYKFGLFNQKIIDGYQVEFPDKWLTNRNVWEVKKLDEAVEVKFGGEVDFTGDDNTLSFDYINYDSVLAIPYDTPIVGYHNNVVTNLRLWSAEAVRNDFDLSKFMQAFDTKNTVEAITQVLYPNDAFEEGKILRLKQSYFLVSAGLQDIVNKYKKKNKSLLDFSDYVAVQINDTHPALAIPELMRILMDEENFSWETAWDITTKTFAYTNHTLLAEALETWPVDLMEKVVPRIFMIIKEINEKFCKKLWDDYNINDFDKISDMAIIGDGYVRMAHLAIEGSHSINGVAKLHTELLKTRALNDFYKIYHEKFNNKTNGITHRRWIINSNPKLTSLITKFIGEEWKKDTYLMEEILKFKDNSEFREKLFEIKLENKKKLAKYIMEKQNIEIDPNSIFDIHAKRLHEYKRQTLNILHIMALYNELKRNPNLDIEKRTFIFAAKAAPGYYMAKQIIKLINTVAEMINNDKSINDKIKVVFLENYSVTIAEMIIPACDVSEQISTASKEASGTGNMKFMMNGAITVGTLDGANVEIHELVGDDNMIIFGLNKDEVYEYYENNKYSSYDYYNNDIRIKEVLDQLINGFLPNGFDEYKIIFDSLLAYNDPYFVLKDFESYAVAQEKINELYKNKGKWINMMIENIAYSGHFSSDNTIKKYADEIWHL
jgi:starch phosphorylase